MNINDFGEDFKWGVSTAAYQIEGAYNIDGKGLSIWDKFSNTRGKTYAGHNGNIACDFYHKYEQDISIIKNLNIPKFRFSVSWPRIFPSGIGIINNKGIDFYQRVIDFCLESGIEPWLTLYHWDLPLELEKKGGWANREIINWFREYTELCAKKFGDRVKHWMILNEPMAFTGAGYFIGLHAPGRRGINSFLRAAHHAAICQAEGARIIRDIVPGAEIGTTFSCSHIEPYKNTEKNIRAAVRVDALLNRMFIEPALGLGYPVAELKLLQRIEKFYQQHDDKLIQFDYDFIGIQNYTRELVKHSYFTPFINASIVKASKRKVPATLMDWEVYPESIYKVLKKYSAYPNVKKIYVTENGAAFTDIVINNKVHDPDRINYLQDNIQQVLRAKQEGVNVQGYFAWTLLDNFEWAEGYYPRFGLVHVDFQTQQRIIKSSGYWYRDFLAGTRAEELANESISQFAKEKMWKFENVKIN